jgi:general secretion pathway protein G
MIRHSASRKKNKRNHEAGFTLYELVVVAGIILLFASIVLSRLDVSRAKGRDAQKVSELKSLQNALEIYQLDVGSYPQPSSQPARNNAGDNGMALVLRDVVEAGYIPSIPTPPKGSAVPGIDTYYYQTQDTDEIKPACNGKRLGEVPYMIYFYTEQPRTLPQLSLIEGETDIPQDSGYSYGYCLTL